MEESEYSIYQLDPSLDAQSLDVKAFIFLTLFCSDIENAVC